MYSVPSIFTTEQNHTDPPLEDLPKTVGSAKKQSFL